MALKLKESDALKSAAPKRSLKVPCLSEKAKALNLRKEEESQAGVAHIYGRQASFVCEMVKKEKELVQILLPHFKVQKLWPQCTVNTGCKRHPVCAIRYLRERDGIPITFIIVYCCNCSIYYQLLCQQRSI